MDPWDFALLVVAGFAAVVGLARLMNGRRRQLAEELQRELEQMPRGDSRSNGNDAGASAASRAT